MPPSHKPVQAMTTAEIDEETTTIALLGPPTLTDVMACAVAYLQAHASPEALHEIGLLFSDNHREIAWERLSGLVRDSMQAPIAVSE